MTAFPDEEMLEAMQADMELPGFEPITEIPEGKTGREHFADKLREYFAEMTNADFSNISTAELLDAIEYFVFPNFHPWAASPCPWSTASARGTMIRRNA